MAFISKTLGIKSLVSNPEGLTLTYIRCEEGPIDSDILNSASSASVSGAKEDNSVLKEGIGVKIIAKKEVRMMLIISIGIEYFSKIEAICSVNSSLST